MNISPQEWHTVHTILDTRVILDGEVKEDIVMQEEENYIKNDYLPTNMTANVKLNIFVPPSYSSSDNFFTLTSSTLTLAVILVGR